MTKIKNNPLLKGATGMFGDIIVYRQVRGGVVMANKPKPSTTVSASQLQVKDKFKKATSYAKRQMTDTTAKALYEAAKGDKMPSAYAVAVRDFLKAPTIDQLDLSLYTACSQCSNRKWPGSRKCNRGMGIHNNSSQCKGGHVQDPGQGQTRKCDKCSISGVIGQNCN